MSKGNDNWGEETARYQNALPHEQRKRDGVWFTPMELALPTARHTLLPLLDRRTTSSPLRICDPAVGGGSFLIAGLDAVQNHPGCLAEFHGIDLEEATTQIAVAALRARNAKHVDIRIGDGLTEWQPESFDCVLTNPPWETMQDSPEAKTRVTALRPLFHHQGKGKLYTYRLFLERSLELLRPGGRLGMIVPASLWFDREAEPLRQLLLNTCDWQWLFGFENRERIFAIDSRYRFGAIVATKGGHTKEVKTAFGKSRIDEWATESPPHVCYGREELRQFSPHSGAFVEVESQRDLQILKRMHLRSRPMIGEGGALTWRQGDFNMTSDKSKFIAREHAEREGYRHTGDGVWRCSNSPNLIALRQGAMLYDLQVNAGAHESGIGHKTKWRAPNSHDELKPLYLVEEAPWLATAKSRSPARIGLRALSNATNERTAIACLLPDVPCGNSIGVLTPQDPSQPLLQLAGNTAILSSLPFDWGLRMRLGGTNLNRFVLTDCILPVVDQATFKQLARIALRMCATMPWTKGLWQMARDEDWCPANAPATDPEERRKLTTQIDAIVSRAYGLSYEDVEWVTRGESFLKGFWRIERHLPMIQRRPNRWLTAIAD